MKNLLVFRRNLFSFQNFILFTFPADNGEFVRQKLPVTFWRRVIDVKSSGTSCFVVSREIAGNQAVERMEMNKVYLHNNKVHSIGHSRRHYRDSEDTRQRARRACSILILKSLRYEHTHRPPHALGDPWKWHSNLSESAANVITHRSDYSGHCAGRIISFRPRGRE